MSTCSIAARESAEPLAGTAVTAPTWLLIEQPGPWGAKALTESRLAGDLGRALASAAAGSGVRIGLIRRPGRHPGASPSPSRSPGAHRRVFAAHTVPGRSWVRAAGLTDLRQLRDLDFTALGEGRHGGLWEPYEGDPLALVCTNGRRDRCCALLGRPLAAELAGSGTPGVWETTHLGGHRFAPTLLVLPYGYAYGQVGAHVVKGVLDAVRGGRILAEGCRGRSAWSRPGQAAELAVRGLTGEQGAEALSVREAGGSGPLHTVTVTHADGRSWRVAVAEDTTAPPVPASCGAEPAVQSRMEVTGITVLPRTV